MWGDKLNGEVFNKLFETKVINEYGNGKMNLTWQCVEGHIWKAPPVNSHGR